MTERLRDADTLSRGPGDLERQAIAASLRGEDDATEALWISAHNEWLALADPARAARCIHWLVLDLFNRREWARGNGWLARGVHLLEPVGDCAALGLLRVLEARNHLRLGDIEAAAAAADGAMQLARQYDDDAELNVFSRLALALLYARRGATREAAPLFDEIMIGVTVDDVSPVAVGVVYCAAIDACRSLFDLSRAREYTTALDRWCATQQHMVAFRGKCLVHRTEVLRLSGEWSQAFVEAEQACAWSGAHENSFRYPSGAAFYELGELHRLRGDFEEATTAYRQASEHGQVPEPGLTMLHFAQGNRDLAATAIRRLMHERQGSVSRAGVLLAAVEVLSSVGEMDDARAAADELMRMREQMEAPVLRAFAAHAAGAVCLAEGDTPAALKHLREAWMAWQELELPYQAACVRVLLGQACQRSGDPIAAEFEFDGARKFFERVSAQPDVERVDRLMQSAVKSDAQPLSAREVQVIELLATGRTNREIAQALSISERTVDRHVSNILLKLNLPTRSAATAYAYEHDLVVRPG
ncbi:MAG TPA: LuxR C-terminal-related transcriptional regulator [Gemmatimonadaceae bacterium]